MEYSDTEYYQHRYNVAVDIEKLFDEEQHFTINEECIYMVPPKLYKLNPKAYTPNVVCIGTYHRNNENLQWMKSQKVKHAKRFIRNSEASLDDLVSRVEELESRIRRCYSVKTSLSSEEFTKLIFVDCCFTLQFLLDDFSKKDSIKPWLSDDIHWDLLLIENQIPFFVFEEIYNLAFASRLSNGEQEPFWNVATIWILNLDEQAEGSDEQIDNILHFTDMYRRYRLQTCRNQLPERVNEIIESRFSATELKQAGVKFKVNEESKCFLDLQFSDGYLTIPKLKVTDHTKIILRNMVAFEQLHYRKASYFTDYIIFLDFLINNENDVDILSKNGIIINYLGDSKAVAEMFNDLGKLVVLGNTNAHYIRVSKDLNAFCKHPWQSRKATLRRDYFNTPWKTVASIAGVVLLMLAIIQTICSILQVV